ncbi:MAG: hypothetical protein H6828_00080 [Planctomycetes bacterium]|nr:hypothetical protein [Planctomycetota bacterium]
MKRALVRLLLLVLGLLLGLGAGEFAARRLLGRGGLPFDAEAERAAVREQLSRLDGALPLPGKSGRLQGETRVELVVHPFVGYDAARDRELDARELARFARPDPTRYRVAILGGSVAGVFGNYGSKPLAARLEAEPELAGRKVEFLFYGRGGHKQPQALLRLAHLYSLGVHPDLVITIDGFNEVAVGTNNPKGGLHPLWPNFSQWLPLVYSPANGVALMDAYTDVRYASRALRAEGERYLASPLSDSGLYAWYVRRRLARLQSAQLGAQKAYLELLDQDVVQPALRGPAWGGSARDAAVVCVKSWRECSLQTWHLCAANGATFVHVLQPTLHDEGAKPLSDEERESCAMPAEWIEGTRIGYPLLRQAGKSLVHEGAPFYDASGLFADAPQTLYYDACHFGEEGCALLADFVADAVLRELRRE